MLSIREVGADSNGRLIRPDDQTNLLRLNQNVPAETRSARQEAP
jgi:hypothetical protein